MIADIMRTRRSVRRFSDKKVTREILADLIDVAISAPSASNNQPWRFFVIDDKAIINRLADAVQRRVDRVAANIQAEFQQNFKRYGDYFVRFSQAPALIIPLYKKMQMLSNMLKPGLDESTLLNIETMEFNSGIVSTSLAIQNLLLYAHATGLGASCMTGPLLAMDDIRDMIGAPSQWHIACLIPIGYSDEEPKVQGRKTVDSVLRFVDVANIEAEKVRVKEKENPN